MIIIITIIFCCGVFLMIDLSLLSAASARGRTRHLTTHLMVFPATFGETVDLVPAHALTHI